MARRMPTGRQRQAGFTYLGLLILLVLMGVVLAQAGTLWSQTRQREREADLLFYGDQFRQAIAAYYLAQTPNAYPQTLNDLLEDPRVPYTRRFLRQIYPDPMTGKRDWILIKAPGNGIMGVYSPAPGTPLKQGNFRAADAAFAGAKSYAAWQFEVSNTPNAPAGATSAADTTSAPAPEASRQTTNPTPSAKNESGQAY